MSIPATDIWAALSSAPTDKPVRAARPADVSRTERHQKGFSAVLRKMRDVDAKDELRKTDDTASSSKTDDRSSVKDARAVENDVRTRGKDGKGRTATGTETERPAPGSHSAKKDDQPGVRQANENGQTGTAQATSSSPRAVNTTESDSSKGHSVDGSATAGDPSLTAAEVQLHVDPQGQVPLFLSTLGTSATNQQPGDQPLDAEGSDLPGTGTPVLAEAESSPSTSLVHHASASVLATKRDGSADAPVGNREGGDQNQPQQTLGRSATPVAEETPVLVASDASQSSSSRESGVANRLAGQDSSTRPSLIDSSSLNAKASTLGLKDVQPTLEPIRKDQTTENPKADTDGKVNGQFLDHPLLSPSQGQSLGGQLRDNGALNGAPLSQQGPKPVMEFTEDFREMWAGSGDGKQGQGEGKPIPMAVSDQLSVLGQRTESFAVGAQGAASSGAGSMSHGGGSIAQAQPAQPAQVTAPSPFPLATKSVVFDVIQPDLGHVNIRVAMTNDVVHAHLSTDRQEVGQSLISGQDRLQSSLQANGFDMGQFRVDIDRQSAGRSFQQGFSQEQQERGWHQQGSWGEGTSASQTYEDTRAPRQGLLNLMA